MKITHVNYRRLKSHPNRYGHDCIEAQAQISEGESSEEALEKLREWVLGRLSEVNQADETAEKIGTLDERLARRERDLERMNEEIEQAKKAVITSEKLQALARAILSDEEMESLFGDDGIPF